METTAETIDFRIALLERDRHAPLTAEQRVKLPKKLSDLDESIAALRAFRLADGGSEPATRFNPLPIDAGLSGDRSDDRGEEAPCA